MGSHANNGHVWLSFKILRTTHQTIVAPRPSTAAWQYPLKSSYTRFRLLQEEHQYHRTRNAPQSQLVAVVFSATKAFMG